MIQPWSAFSLILRRICQTKTVSGLDFFAQNSSINIWKQIAIIQQCPGLSTLEKQYTLQTWCSHSWVEVFNRCFTEPWTSPTASMDKHCKALQGSFGNLPDCNLISRSISLTGGLLNLSGIKGDSDSFSPVFLFAAVTLQLLLPDSCSCLLWPHPCFCLQLPESCTCLCFFNLLGYSLLLSSWLLSACSGACFSTTPPRYLLKALLWSLFFAPSSLRFCHWPHPFLTWESEMHFG